MDILVTNFSEDFSTLYRGTGGGFFEDVSGPSGVGAATYLSLSWGAAFSDLDNDGDLDLAIANGHIYPQIDSHPETGLTYQQKGLLLENDGHGRFTDVTAAAGPGFAVKRSARGLAVGDYDDDGDLDLLVTVLDSPPALLRNDSKAGSWLGVVLEAQPGRGPLIGTRVRVTAGGRTQERDLASGESYLSAHDPRLHFGLGGAARVERLEVLWPGGGRTLMVDLPAGQYLKVSLAP